MSFTTEHPEQLFCSICYKRVRVRTSPAGRDFYAHTEDNAQQNMLVRWHSAEVNGEHYPPVPERVP